MILEVDKNKPKFNLLGLKFKLDGHKAKWTVHEGQTRRFHKPNGSINLNGYVWMVNENEWPWDKNGRS